MGGRCGCDGDGRFQTGIVIFNLFEFRLNLENSHIIINERRINFSLFPKVGTLGKLYLNIVMAMTGNGASLMKYIMKGGPAFPSYASNIRTLQLSLFPLHKAIGFYQKIGMYYSGGHMHAELFYA